MEIAASFTVPSKVMREREGPGRRHVILSRNSSRVPANKRTLKRQEWRHIMFT